MYTLRNLRYAVLCARAPIWIYPKLLHLELMRPTKRRYSSAQETPPLLRTKDSTAQVYGAESKKPYVLCNSAYLEH